MNKNIRLVVTVLPLFLVPLINNRKEIKHHPDIQKLSKNSSMLYGKVKEQAENMTSFGSKSLGTTKDIIGETYTDSRIQHNYKKQMKDYKKQQKSLEKLKSKFDKDKEKHRENRMQNLNSHITLDEDEKENRMTVTKGHKKLDINTPNTKNIQELNDTFVLGTDYEDDYEADSLFMKHKDTLDKKSARLRAEKYDRAKQKNRLDHSLFGEHRRNNEQFINQIGRKTGHNEDYVESDSHKNFLDWKAQHNK